MRIKIILKKNTFFFQYSKLLVPSQVMTVLFTDHPVHNNCIDRDG